MTMVVAEYQLDVVPGDYGLPSLDQECLAVLAYCAMNGITIQINYSNDLYFTRLPALHNLADSETIRGADDIIAYLDDRSANFHSRSVSGGGDEQIKRQYDIRSYRALIDRLDHCFHYLHWYDEENYKENTGSWYGKICSFPMNLVVPRMLRQRAIEKIERQFTQKVLEHDSKFKMMEKRILFDATRCLNALSKRLTAPRSYLVGDRPSSADAYLFSYLALLYRMPAKKEIIKSHIRMEENLRQFVEQTLQKYFAESLKSFQEAQARAADANTTVRWSDLLFCGTVAALAMVYYAFANGMIMAATDDDDDEEFEFEPVQEEEDQQS